MINMVQNILNWSELWTVFIPLIVLWLHKKQPYYLKPVIFYLYAALIINFLIDVTYFQGYVPRWLESNLFLYNTHSIIRFIFFICFFLVLNQPFFQNLKKIVPLFSLLLVIVNFLFFEDFFNYYSFSSRLLTFEAGLLLLYCLQYYFYTL